MAFELCPFCFYAEILTKLPGCWWMDGNSRFPSGMTTRKQRQQQEQMLRHFAG